MKIKKKIKYFFLFLVSILPMNKLRIFFLNSLFKYNIDYSSFISLFVIINCKKCEIKNSKIDLFNYIHVEEVFLDNISIKKKNIFKGFKLLKLKNKIKINNNNKIYGQYPLSKNSNFIIEDDCLIGSNNFFDLSDNINIKNKCIILNFCQLWTHGFNYERKIYTNQTSLINGVKLENCVTVIGNVKISNNCVIKIGSIVTKSIEGEGIYTSNELIKKSNLC